MNVSNVNYLLSTVKTGSESTGTININQDLIIAINLFINILGMVGAVTIIAVMRMPHFRSMPRSLLYISLAIIDLVFCIYLMITRVWVLGFVEALGQSSRIGCQIDRFLVRFLAHMDAWLLITLTGERMIAIVKPLEVNTIVTRSKVKVVLVSMAMFFTILDGERCASSDLANASSQLTNITMTVCARVNYYNLSPKIFSFMDTVNLLLISFIPFSIILVFNIILSWKLFKFKKVRADLGATGSRSRIQNEAHKITGMIMAASLGFILFTGPIIIYLMTGLHSKNDPIAFILTLIYQMNPAANCYIYFLSGRLFRQEVKKLFFISCRKKLDDTTPQHKSMTSVTTIT